MFRRNFTTLTLALIPVAIAINIAVGQLVIILGLPIYLDSIGTVLAGLLAGPLVGLVTGALSNLIWGVTLQPTYLPYFYVAAVIGLLAGVFGRLGWARKIWSWLIGGLITAITAAIIGLPVTVNLGGVTGTATDVIVAAARATGATVLEASFIQGIISDSIDKIVTYLVVFLIALALPVRFKARFPQAENLPGRTATESFED